MGSLEGLQSNFKVIRVDGLREVLLFDAGDVLAVEQTGESLQQVLHRLILWRFGSDGRFEDRLSSMAITVAGGCCPGKPLATNRRSGS
jgi:hypothetical protein